jgi:hypothetical protein
MRSVSARRVALLHDRPPGPDPVWNSLSAHDFSARRAGGHVPLREGSGAQLHTKFEDAAC